MRLAVIGTGKMGRAIVAGLLSRNLIPPTGIIGVSKTENSKQAFLSLAPPGTLTWTESPEEAAHSSDIILLGVKPFQMEELLLRIKSTSGTPFFLSIAAGLKLSFYEKLLGPSSRVVRAMPNTPVTLGLGVTAYTPNSRATTSDLEWVETIFNAVGDCYRVEESQLDAITALSGSGPAFVYRIIEALAAAAVKEGLPPEQALPIAAQTLIGASHMIRQSGLSPEALVQQVVSKGGTTEAGLKVLESSSLNRILEATIKAAADRSRELSKT